VFLLLISDAFLLSVIVIFSVNGLVIGLGTLEFTFYKFS